MPKERHSAFSFIIVGGLDKPFYFRFRDLMKKYGLKEKGLVECMLWFTLTHHENCDADIMGSSGTWEAIVEEYKSTAPVDMPPLPEVV